MARRYDYKFGPDKTKTAFGWAMEQCEERLLWAAISDIEARIPPEQTGRKMDFFGRFFEEGIGVTFSTLDWINGFRKRAGLNPVTFIETHVEDYARMTDRLKKAELRRQMRDDYFLLDAPGRRRWQREAEEDTARLHPPHYTHDEIIQRRQTWFPPSNLTQKEQAVRMRVIDQIAPVPEPQHEPEVQPKRAAVTRAIRQLKIAKKPETIARIIGSLEPDDALDLAEADAFEDADMIDALVARSLEDPEAIPFPR